VSLAVGDFDGDHILDLATIGGYDYSGEVSVLLGNDNSAGAGSGSFAAPTSVGIGSTPTSVAVGDFDGDGKLDLGVTSNTYYSSYYYYYGSYQGKANVLLGSGDGSFSGPNVTPLGYGYFQSAAVGRFDGDNIDDLATVNYYYGTASVLEGDSSGYLQGPTDFYAGNSPWSVATKDLDGDGDNDLVVANYYGNDVGVLLGNGQGGFTAATNYFAGTNPPTSVVIGDFNHDTKLDIATTNSSNELNVLYGRGDGTFAVAVNAATVPGAYALAAGDFNGDGWLDAATGNPAGNSVSVLLNDHTWPPAPSSLSINDVSVTEGNAGTVAAVFTVTRSDNLASVVTVNYGTANGGALAGSDYAAKTGTLTFGAGVATMTITILVNGDVTDEYDQGFYVNLSGASGAVITDGQGFGTIMNDDLPPTITITPKVSAKEGGNNNSTLFNFVVTLSAASEKSISVSFATANGTATTADNDYVARTGTLTFAPGVTSQTISVQVKGDKNKESNETFYVNLSGAANATITTSQGVGEILDDDTPPGKRKMFAPFDDRDS
jgi:hypothetical protein